MVEAVCVYWRVMNMPIGHMFYHMTLTIDMVEAVCLLGEL